MMKVSGHEDLGYKLGRIPGQGAVRYPQQKLIGEYSREGSKQALQQHGTCGCIDVRAEDMRMEEGSFKSHLLVERLERVVSRHQGIMA